MQKLFKETLHIIEQSSFSGLIRGGIITEKDKNSMGKKKEGFAGDLSICLSSNFSGQKNNEEF